MVFSFFGQVFGWRALVGQVAVSSISSQVFITNIHLLPIFHFSFSFFHNLNKKCYDYSTWDLSYWKVATLHVSQIFRFTSTYIRFCDFLKFRGCWRRLKWSVVLFSYYFLLQLKSENIGISRTICGPNTGLSKRAPIT